MNRTPSVGEKARPVPILAPARGPRAAATKGTRPLTQPGGGAGVLGSPFPTSGLPPPTGQGEPRPHRQSCLAPARMAGAQFLLHFGGGGGSGTGGCPMLSVSHPVPSRPPPPADHPAAVICCPPSVYPWQEPALLSCSFIRRGGRAKPAAGLGGGCPAWLHRWTVPAGSLPAALGLSQLCPTPFLHWPWTTGTPGGGKARREAAGSLGSQFHRLLLHPLFLQ